MKDARDDGQAFPFVVLLVVAVAGAMALLGLVGKASFDRARAGSAADAAALAGAVAGRDGAAKIAEENGAVLTRFEQIGADVEVTARAGRAEKSARARKIEQGRHGELSPAFRATVVRAEQILGQAVVVEHFSSDAIRLSEESDARVRTIASQAGLCGSGQRRYVICRT